MESIKDQIFNSLLTVWNTGIWWRVIIVINLIGILVFIHRRSKEWHRTVVTLAAFATLIWILF